MRAETDIRPAKILVVEDETLIRLNGVEILQDAGFQVIDVASADEALAILESAPDVRLIFTDIDMPGSMDGLALAELVHARWPNIALLLTSGHHQVRDNEVPDEGRFVAKPYRAKVVVEEIKDLLKIH